MGCKSLSLESGRAAQVLTKKGPILGDLLRSFYTAINSCSGSADHRLTGECPPLHYHHMAGEVVWRGFGGVFGW